MVSPDLLRLEHEPRATRLEREEHVESLELGGEGTPLTDTLHLERYQTTCFPRYTWPIVCLSSSPTSRCSCRPVSPTPPVLLQCPMPTSHLLPVFNLKLETPLRLLFGTHPLSRFLHPLEVQLALPDPCLTFHVRVHLRMDGEHSLTLP